MIVIWRFQIMIYIGQSSSIIQVLDVSQSHLSRSCAITSIWYGNKIFFLTKRCFLDVYTILHQYICIVMQTQNVVHFPKWQVTWTLIVFPSPKILNASNQLKYDKPWFPFWNSIGAKIKNAFCHQYWFLFWNMTSQKFF